MVQSLAAAEREQTVGHVDSGRQVLVDHHVPAGQVIARDHRLHFVQEVHAPGHVGRQLDGLVGVDRERGLLVQEAVQGAAGHELADEDQVGQAGAGAEQRQDVR